MSELLSDFVAKYQTIIGNGIGFAGVIITLVVNAVLSRKQQERHLRDERKAIQTALVADLLMIRDSLDERINTLDRLSVAEEHLFWTEIKDISVFYQRLNERVGLLPPTKVRVVMEAYLAFKKLPEIISIYDKLHATEDENITKSVQPGTRLYEALYDLHVSVRDKILSAVSRIEDRNG